MQGAWIAIFFRVYGNLQVRWEPAALYFPLTLRYGRILQQHQFQCFPVSGVFLIPQKAECICPPRKIKDIFSVVLFRNNQLDNCLTCILLGIILAYTKIHVGSLRAGNLCLHSQGIEGIALRKHIHNGISFGGILQSAIWS